MHGRITDFDYSRRISRFDGDKMGSMSVAYDEQLAGPNGMHFHCWIPKQLSDEQKIEFYTNFKIQTKQRRDAVSFSWDLI